MCQICKSFSIRLIILTGLHAIEFVVFPDLIDYKRVNFVPDLIFLA